MGKIKASSAALGALHARFAEVLNECLDIEVQNLKGTTYTDDTGEVQTVAPQGANASILNVVRGFLKDNEITGGDDDEKLQELREQYNSTLETRRDVAAAVVQKAKEISKLPDDDILLH